MLSLLSSSFILHTLKKRKLFLKDSLLIWNAFLSSGARLLRAIDCSVQRKSHINVVVFRLLMLGLIIKLHVFLLNLLEVNDLTATNISRPSSR